MITRSALTIASAAVLVLGATACGESSSSTAPSSSPATTPATSAVATGPRIVDASLTTPDGRRRSYRVYVPASVPEGRPVPLLLALHGGTGSGRQFEASSGFDLLADASRFIVVYPDGTEIGGDSLLARGRVWNGGRCCGPAAAAQVDDVRFLSLLIDEISNWYEIDSSRVYATGHSNGAIMSYRLACELSDKIAAIGVQAGSLEVEPCEPSQPVSVIHVHGTADRNIPIEGGKGAGISRVEFHPPTAAVRTLARVDGCPSDPGTAVAPDNPDVTIETWKPCRRGTSVEFVRVKGASHAWMGQTGTRAEQGLTGAPYLDYEASAAIWAFLASHPRR